MTFTKEELMSGHLYFNLLSDKNEAKEKVFTVQSVPEVICKNPFDSIHINLIVGEGEKVKPFAVTVKPTLYVGMILIFGTILYLHLQQPTRGTGQEAE